MKAGASVVLVLVCSLVAVVQGGLYGKNSDVVQLSVDNFVKEVFGSNDVWLVEFYAPWCGHCKNLAPHWEAAAKKLKGLVKIGAVDCDVEKNKELAAYFKIQGFPTIKIFPGEYKPNPHNEGAAWKEGLDYQGARTTEGIVQAAMGHLKYFGDLVDENNIDEFMLREGSKVLLFSEKKKTTGLYKALSGHFNGRMHFAQSPASLGSRYDFDSFPKLLVVDHQGARHAYSGKLSAVDLTRFLEPFGSLPRPYYEKTPEEQAPPPPPAKPAVHHLTNQDEFDKLCSSGFCVLGFLNPEQESHEDYLKVLLSASEEYLQFFKVGWVDGTKFSSFSSVFLGSVDDLPRMLVLSSPKKLYTPFIGAFSGDSVKNFLGKVVHGKKKSIPLDAVPPFV